VTLWVPMQEDLRVQTNMSGTGTAWYRRGPRPPTHRRGPGEISGRSTSRSWG